MSRLSWVGHFPSVSAQLHIAHLPVKPLADYASPSGETDSPGVEYTAPGDVSPNALAVIPCPALKSWGIAKIEHAYAEDPVLRVDVSRTDGTSSQASRFEHLEAKPGTADGTLPALLYQIRRNYRTDCWLYWGETESEYLPLAVFSQAEQLTPFFDIAFGQPYTPLAADLMEAAGIEWALRQLPDKHPLLQHEEQPRPLVMWGGIPHLNITVTRDLLPGTPGAEQRHFNPLDYYRWYTLRRHLKHTTRSVWETFLIPHQQLSGDVSQWQEIYFRFLPAYAKLSALIWAYGHSLMSQGLLSPGFLRSVTHMGRMAPELSQLREVAQALMVQQKEPGLQWAKRSGFRHRWQMFLNDYGFLGALDLAQPRIMESQEAWFSAIASPWHPGLPQDTPTLKERLTSPVWQDFQRLYALRDLLFSDTLWALYQVKQRILKKLPDWVNTGRLEKTEDFWHLNQEEVSKRDQTGTTEFSPGHLILQDLLTTTKAEAVSNTELTGTGLNNGMAQGRIWRPNNVATPLPEGFFPGDTILCLPVFDFTHLPLLQQVSGVLLAQGHALSHSSHLLREWNRPAIVNVKGLEQLKQGDEVRIDSATGTVYRLEASASEVDS